jgi:nucleotide-binding universal stress UspA family protein
VNDLNQRVLIAIDGSVQSINAAYYAGRILIPEKTTLTLFLVEDILPETLWDSRPDGSEDANSTNLNGWWDENHIQYNRKIVEKVRKTLVKEGYPEASVEVKIRPRRTGIARDIIKESKKGYDLVVAGRIGHNIHTGTVLGNCARKLTSSLTHTSLVML